MSEARRQRRAFSRHYYGLPEQRLNMSMGGPRLWTMLAHLNLLPKHTAVRFHTQWWHVYRVLRTLNAKRFAYRVFAPGRLLSVDYRVDAIKGQLVLLRANTLKSPRIGVVFDLPTEPTT